MAGSQRPLATGLSVVKGDFCVGVYPDVGLRRSATRVEVSVTGSLPHSFQPGRAGGGWKLQMASVRRTRRSRNWPGSARAWVPMWVSCSCTSAWMATWPWLANVSLVRPNTQTAAPGCSAPSRQLGYVRGSTAGRPVVQSRLIVDPFLCGGDQLGASSSGFVSQLDGLLEGHGEAVELPDDNEVERAVVPGGFGDHPGELVPGAGGVSDVAETVRPRALQ